MLSITLHPIGVVHSPFREQRDTPIQPSFAEGAEGALMLYEQYAEALRDLEGFERIWAICLLHRASDFRPMIVPYRDDVERGVFATRAPSRPNPIGLSPLRLLEVDGLRVRVGDIDILDGTPLLDIKPYIPVVDAHPDSKAGWFDGPGAGRTRADGRFEPR